MTTFSMFGRIRQIVGGIAGVDSNHIDVTKQDINTYNIHIADHITVWQARIEDTTINIYHCGGDHLLVSIPYFEL